MKLGAQMYTVRDFCKDLNGLSETLKKIADIGYKTVQVSGTCDYEPQWLKEQLEKNGLECAITHYNTDKIISSPKEVCQAHKVFNCKYVGIGWYDLNAKSTDEFIETFKASAKAVKECGLSLCYHNHDPEFKIENGKTKLDIICESFTADELKITLDTFWAQAGGADPAKLIRELKGRTPCIHLKDMAYDRMMMPVGGGNMNFESIFAAAEASGVEYALVEQDNCNGEDPFKCLKQSFDYCVANGIKE